MNKTLKNFEAKYEMVTESGCWIWTAALWSGSRKDVKMTAKEKLDLYECLLRQSQLFKNPLLIAYYQRKIDLINKELDKP